jgi:hypothetical protein
MGWTQVSDGETARPAPSRNLNSALNAEGGPSCSRTTKRRELFVYARVIQSGFVNLLYCL